MSSATVLIADDDRGIRTVLTQALGRAGYEVRTTDNAATLWRWLSEGDGDLVVTDVIMPDENGLDLIPRIQKIRPDLRIIVMSAQNTLLTAVKAAERGAFEYLPKPFDLSEFIAVINRALSMKSNAQAPANDTEDRLPIVGRSAAMQDIYRTVARLMNTDLTAMITGESGTGKELVARALHDFGRRRSGSFVAVNMAAIPRELIESELFGHEKGSFTGAVARAAGHFEQAAGGTLFLDEIGDMPPEAQTRLLRVLQDGQYTTVGGRTPIKANVRIIAATHRDLTQLIKMGGFREDLYYRLNVVPIRLPPLRQRVEDIQELIVHFLSQAAAEGLPQKSLEPAAIERLKTHRWPGNVRELENLVKRLVALYAEPVIGIDVVEMELASLTALPVSVRDHIQPASLGDAIERHLQEYFDSHNGALPPRGLYDRVLRELERTLISLTLLATRGNQVKAADILGLNRNTLRKKLRYLDLNVVRGPK